MRPLRGIIHVHSNYSYDGQHSLAEIAAYGRRHGYAFIGMTEHSDTFNTAKMAEYIKHCHAVSAPDCVVIPGIEFRCADGLHLLGLGTEHYMSAVDPVAVADFIRDRGGLAIVAHPIRHDYRIPTALARAVDGIEVWNASYDGRFVPNDRSLMLLKTLRDAHGDSLLAFGAEDLHRLADRWKVETTVSCDYPSKASILAALKRGTFTTSNPCFRLHARHDVEPLSLALIRLVRQLYALGKLTRDGLQGRVARWRSHEMPKP